MEKPRITIALAGYTNVGKSVIFNHLTGLHQHIGNWPGKTIEKAAGSLAYKRYHIDILDLPGICSLSTYSSEELITREYILFAKPDFIIDVVDSTNLERNLMLTLQFIELEKPLVLALNMVNLLKKHGITIDYKKLATTLGVPVVPVIAPQGNGLSMVLDQGIFLVQQAIPPKTLKYGKEVEICIEKLCQMLPDIGLPYPKRYLAIKLLEKEEEIEKLFSLKYLEILEMAQHLSLELEKIHGHHSALVIADERCHLAMQIVRQVMTVTKPQKPSLNELLDHLTGHRIWGYPVMIAVLGLLFFIIFKGGNYTSLLLEQLFSGLPAAFHSIFGNSMLATLAWGGVATLLALIELVFPYILPFYLLLFFLENLGYLARVAYLMDSLMQKLGVHGKACIPMILGFGCNVPACLACRIMGTQRERFITGLLSVFVPCSALTVVVAGLVGKFIGLGSVIGLYLLIFLLIFLLGKLAAVITPGESTALIMEMPNYRSPNIKTILFQTWFRLKEFIYIASPLVIVSGIIIEGAYQANLLAPINSFLSPLTSGWLGLPTATGILLIFGILRKELILVMLASILGTTDFTKVLTQPQMLVLALVSMLYIPCVATIAALYQEFGWQKALLITLFKISLAIVAGGLMSKLLNLFWV